MSDVPDMQQMLAAASRLRAEVARAQEDLAGKIVSAESGGGLVRCEASARGEILSLTIDPVLLAEGQRKMLEDLAVGAINLALQRAGQLAQEEMARITAGLPMPPGMLGGV